MKLNKITLTQHGKDKDCSPCHDYQRRRFDIQKLGTCPFCMRFSLSGAIITLLMLFIAAYLSISPLGIYSIATMAILFSALWVAHLIAFTRNTISHERRLHHAVHEKHGMPNPQVSRRRVLQVGLSGVTAAILLSSPVDIFSRRTKTATAALQTMNETPPIGLSQCLCGEVLQSDEFIEIIRNFKNSLKQGIAIEEAIKTVERSLAASFTQQVANAVGKALRTAATVQSVVSLLLMTKTALGGPCRRCLMFNTVTGEASIFTDCYLSEQTPVPCQFVAPDDGIPIFERCLNAWTKQQGTTPPSEGEIRYERDDSGNPIKGIRYVDCSDRGVESRCPTYQKPHGTVEYTTNDDGRAVKVIYDRAYCDDEIQICTPSLAYRENPDGSINTGEFRDVDKDDEIERLVYADDACELVLECPPTKEQLGEHKLVQMSVKGRVVWREVVYDAEACPTEWPCPTEDHPAGTERVVERNGQLILLKYQDGPCCD